MVFKHKRVNSYKYILFKNVLLKLYGAFPRSTFYQKFSLINHNITSKHAVLVTHETHEPQHIRPRLRRSASHTNRDLATIRPRIRPTPVPRSHGNRKSGNVNVMDSRFRSLACSFYRINFFRLKHTILTSVKTWWGVAGFGEKNKSLFPSSVTSYGFSGSPQQVLIEQLSAWIPFNLFGIHAFSTIVKKLYCQIWIVGKACDDGVVAMKKQIKPCTPMVGHRCYLDEILTESIYEYDIHNNNIIIVLTYIDFSLFVFINCYYFMFIFFQTCRKFVSILKLHNFKMCLKYNHVYLHINS